MQRGEARIMRRALIVTGGWEGHEPQECAAIYRRWLHDDGFSVRIETSTAVFAEPDIAGLSVIVPIVTRGQIAPDALGGLVSAVAGGVGLVGHHGLADGFRGEPDFAAMLGGQWAASPGDTVDYQVDIAQPDEPVTAGLTGFAWRSEQYYLLVDPANDVVATTRFAPDRPGSVAGATMPVAWKRRHGRGRVFYCSLGHSAKDLETPSLATILRRGLAWAARDEAA
jgi:type 1 glutamine amidotransferase